MRDLKGKNVLITGGSRGIGVYLARAFATEGANLALSARPASLPELEKNAAEMEKLGVKAIPVAAEITNPEARQALLNTVQEKLGPLDVLVNNAGIEYYSPFQDYTPEKIRHIVETNLLATLELTRLALPALLERRSGHIVAIASMAGKSPAPYNSVYSATKAGLVAWSGALAGELAGSGVDVSVICPGFVAEVGMHARTMLKPPALSREVSPERVAQSVVAAVIHNQPEVIIWHTPIRPLLALRDLFPGFATWFYRVSGVGAYLRQKALHQKKE
mgnify:CR=1 FL=1